MKNFIKVRKEDGSTFLKLINKNFKGIEVIDSRYKILYDKDYIKFPLKKYQNLEQLQGLIGSSIKIEIISQEAFSNPKYKYKTIQEALKEVLPENCSKIIPKSYDVIGNIAIVEFNAIDNLDKEKKSFFKNKIAEAISKVNKGVKAVYEKKSQIKGEFRLKDLDLLYGRNQSQTIHKENNCSFILDVKKTYFSPRLSFERKRISDIDIKEDEIIVDMFTGVGPFSIQIAKHHEVRIYSVDKNPNAISFLKKNIEINKLIGDVFPINMEIREIINPINRLGKILKNKVDRVIMNLPEKSLTFLEAACFLLKNSGGILHIYQFSYKPKSIEKAKLNLKRSLAETNWKILNINCSRIVKSFSPSSDLIVIDAKIAKNI